MAYYEQDVENLCTANVEKRLAGGLIVRSVEKFSTIRPQYQHGISQRYIDDIAGMTRFITDVSQRYIVLIFDSLAVKQDLTQLTSMLLVVHIDCIQVFHNFGLTYRRDILEYSWNG